VARVSLSAASEEVASHDPVVARLVATDGPMRPHSDEEIRAMLASVPRGREMSRPVEIGPPSRRLKTDPRLVSGHRP